MSRAIANEVEQRPATGNRSPPWYTMIVLLLVLSTLLTYWWTTGYPPVVRIAGGPANGRYAALANGLAHELRTRLSIQVDVTETGGSLENLQQLETNQVHFALYQPETREILAGPDSSDGDEEPAAFVSNLYPEYLLPVAAKDSSAALDRVENRIWCCNDRLSGDFAVTQLLLQVTSKSGLSVADCVHLS